MSHIRNCNAGIPPISWADTIVLGADIETISSAFGADFPLNLGRIDATQPDPAGRFPDASTASPDEIQVSPEYCNASQAQLTHGTQARYSAHRVMYPPVRQSSRQGGPSTAEARAMPLPLPVLENAVLLEHPGHSCWQLRGPVCTQAAVLGAASLCHLDRRAA